MKLKHATRLFVTLLALSAGILCMRPSWAHAEPDAPEPVAELRFEVSAPYCGTSVQEEEPSVFLADDEVVQLGETVAWVSDCQLGEGGSVDDIAYTPLEGTFQGGEQYQALVVIEALPGHCFDENTKLLIYGEEDYEEIAPVCVEATRLAVAPVKTAEHDWDWGSSERQDPTCQDDGWERLTCRNCSHEQTEVLPSRPDAHVWSEWTIIREPTKAEEGERVRTCFVCEVVDRKVMDRITYPYTPVYEPNTSWHMAATVAWRADASAYDVAAAGVRPATAFVWLDAALRVYDRDGSLLAESLDDYVEATVAGMIPALYIEDAETAAALKDWLPTGGLRDCFVVSTPDNASLVKDAADLLHVRGMIDYSSVTTADRAALLDMVATTNGAHGKVILLSSEVATRENVQLLQRLASTVWVRTPTDTKTIVTHYTNGVHGVVVDDFEAALAKEELFQDDASSLLRIPLVIGHRGDPSTYVENTLDSARGAVAEGADSVENDIHLSTDGELFIFHDDLAAVFMGLGRADIEELQIPVESLSMAELQEHPFHWTDIIEHNEVPAERSRYGKLYGQDENISYTVPALREYIEAFRGTDLVHDTEIKSMNPAIIGHFKALVDEYDAWDQFFTITFNMPILEAIYRDYPEISIGALGMGTFTDVKYEDYDGIAAEEGVEAAVSALYGEIDQWNATYNPSNEGYGEEMVHAARHRGLTVWPWTYSVFDPYSFSRDYMAGVSGLTGDHPWIASNYIMHISSEDVTIASGEDVPKPTATSRVGDQWTLADAELVTLETMSDTETLAIWRYHADMDVNGEIYGSYYLYSNPFVVTTQAAHKHAWGKPTYSWSEDLSTVTARRTCTTCGEEQTETVSTTSNLTKEAACEEPGETTYTAAFENTAFKTQAKVVANVAALGHSWGPWKVTKQATRTVEGQEVRTCNRCGEQETRVIPKRARASATKTAAKTAARQLARTGDITDNRAWIVLGMAGSFLVAAGLAMQRWRQRALQGAHRPRHFA